MQSYNKKLESKQEFFKKESNLTLINAKNHTHKTFLRISPDFADFYKTRQAPIVHRFAPLQMHQETKKHPLKPSVQEDESKQDSSRHKTIDKHKERRESKMLYAKHCRDEA